MEDSSQNDFRSLDEEFPTNSVTGRLPNELLIRIFSLVDDKPRASHLGWIRLTHVCRFWRDLALNTPSLWTTIPTRLGEQWMNEAICRSGSAPIKLYHAPAPQTLSLSKLPVEPIRQRICSLSIGACSTEEREALCRFLDNLQSAPALVDLRLADTAAIPTFGLLLNPPSSLHFPPAFSIHPFPHLRALSLHNISKIPWKDFPFHKLTRLELSSGPWSWELPRDVTEDVSVVSSLLDMLEVTPDLESLELRDFLPSDRNTSFTSPSPRVVSMNRLASLTIRGGESSLLGRLLHSLRMPSFISGHFDCTYFGHEDFHVLLDALNPLMSIRVAEISPKPLRASHNTRDTPRTPFHLSLYPGLSALNERSPSMHLVARADRSASFHHTEFLYDACIVLLQGVRELYLDNFPWKTPDKWWVAFGALKQVREVVFTSRKRTSFLRALVPPSDVVADEERVLFPELRRLHLIDASLDIKAYDLFRRRLRSTPFQQIVAENCTISRNVVKWLGELGLDVGWDGVTESVDGETEDEENESSDGECWPPRVYHSGGGIFFAQRTIIGAFGNGVPGPAVTV